MIEKRPADRSLVPAEVGGAPAEHEITPRRRAHQLAPRHRILRRTTRVYAGNLVAVTIKQREELVPNPVFGQPVYGAERCLRLSTFRKGGQDFAQVVGHDVASHIGRALRWRPSPL